MKIKNDRVSVLDIYDVVRAEDGEIQAISEMWDFGADLVRKAVEWCDKNPKEVEKQCEEKNEHLNSILEAEANWREDT
ncbi:hypothetical protein [Natrinema soli]|uniref:Uncharacterized protein n=1 Tax=Natrinema soli TaxID=1930624 RepID=A0ABD5SMC7_9EURY|nr:hypothetical protein [Natrinema soli]